MTIDGMQFDHRGPWFPLAVAAHLAEGRPPGHYMPRFEHWVGWHHGFLQKGQGFKPISAEEAAALFRATT